MRILLSSALAVSSLIVVVPMLLYMVERAPRPAGAASETNSRSAAALPSRRDGREMRSFEALLAITALQAGARPPTRPWH